MKRDGDFIATVKESLAKRVGFLCSCPSCRRPTVGPHSNQSKSTLIGEGAHICAASRGGARYVESMTDDERRSIDNGIWLCCVCATKIDKDEERYTVALLQQWKVTAELEALRSLESPSYIGLGISRSIFPPPIGYQLSALRQIIFTLNSSGISKLSVQQLSVIIQRGSRDGVSELFEPLTIESIAEAIDVLLLSKEIEISNHELIINR